jgi:centrin-2
MLKIALKKISGSQYSGEIERKSNLSRDSIGSNPFRIYSNSQDFTKRRGLVGGERGFRNQKKS